MAGVAEAEEELEDATDAKLNLILGVTLLRLLGHPSILPHEQLPHCPRTEPGSVPTGYVISCKLLNVVVKRFSAMTHGRCSL